MDEIHNSNNYDEDTGQPYMDFDWNVFVERLFQKPPLNPFDLRMEFLEEIDKKKLTELLANMLITGAKIKYEKQLAELDESEIDELQKYFRSLGFEVEYEIKTTTKYFSDKQKTLPVNYFNIDFKPCSQLLNNNNRPERIV